MYRQKIKQIFAILFMLSCIFCISPISFAAHDEVYTGDIVDRLNIGETTDDAFNFSQYDDVTSNSTADRIAKNTMGTAINIIRIVATGVSIVMLSYMGIKYMMAAPSERAEFKKSATIFIVGAILVFAAGNILGIIVDFTENNITAGSGGIFSGWPL